MGFAKEFEVRNVSRVFGPIVALTDVSLVARAGEVHAIIGENGAGKSTLMNIICGNLRPSAGEMLIDGRPVTFSSPLQAQREGIAIAPQEIMLAPHLTAAENVVLGRHARRGGLVDWAESRRRAAVSIASIDPGIDPAVKAGQLTVAQQQLVQIARVISTGARLLIFDEPTAALTAQESERLFAFIRAFKAEGGAVLYISHRLDEILALADRITVLRDGRTVDRLPPTTTKDAMIRAMAGRDLAGSNLRQEVPSRIAGEIVLKVDGLSRQGEFEDIRFELAKGEILAIGGLIGSGRTELARCIFGDTAADAGAVEVFGRPVRFRGPADAIRAGLVYLPEERKHEGIFPVLSVAENIVLPNLPALTKRLGISWPAVFKAAQGYIRSIPIKAGTPRQPIADLSGGNQQKAILARWLMSSCRILILDEPTRGIDVNAKREIQLLLRRLAQDGLSIVYISSELQEILDVSDRVLMMHEGRVRAIVGTEGATQEVLLAAAMH